MTVLTEATRRCTALRKLERLIREKAFEDEDATLLGFPQEWAESQRIASNVTAMAEVDAHGLVSVWVNTGGYAGEFFALSGGKRILKPIPDHVLKLLSDHVWVCQTPLPPLVVLAKCAGGALPTDGWID